MFKQTCLVGCLCALFCLPLLKATPFTQPAAVSSYIDQYKDIAVLEMQRSGIPASIILGQGIFESGAGEGELALYSNNHFGIKCKQDWQGAVYYHKDDDYVNGVLTKSCFRAYDDPNESYVDHTDFLLVNDRYASLFNNAPTDYVAWAKGLKKCGYATDPLYAKKLISIIEKYQLAQYDTIAPEVVSNEYTATQPADVQAVVSVEETPPPAMRLPDDYQRNMFSTENETPDTRQEEAVPAVSEREANRATTNIEPRLNDTEQVRTTRLTAMPAPSYNISRFLHQSAVRTASPGLNAQVPMRKASTNRSELPIRRR